jgi:Mg-chelatase subunit ChlD
VSSRKHRKRRPKSRAHGSQGALTKGRAAQAALPSSAPSKQAVAARLGQAAAEGGMRRRVVSDLRRILLSAAVVALVLVILYLVLR